MIVFCSILGALLLLLLLPVSVRVQWGQELEIWLGYLFFRIQVNNPEPEQPPESGKKSKKKAKPNKDKPEEKKQRMPFPELVGMITDAVSSATGGLRMLFRNLRVHDLTLRMTVTGEDACATAVEYGKTSAYLYGAYATLTSFIKMKRVELSIQPDFLGERGDFSLDLCVLITPLVALGAVLRMGGAFLWKLIRRRMEQEPAPAQKKPVAATETPAAAQNKAK